MYRLMRKVHLWVGLILAVVLIMEAVTGLILAEPALFGAAKTEKPPTVATQNAPQDGKTAAAPQRQAPSGVYGLAKGLHQGKVGGMNLGWVVDISAVGLAVLTVTGVYLGVVVLRAERRRG